jgi:NADH-quinone oxidoreductase subunit E
MKNKILIIDGDINFLNRSAYLLRQKDYDVLTANDSIKGFQMVKDNSPDLIVLNIDTAHKEEMLEAARAMEDDAAIRNIPVILITDAEKEKALTEELKSQKEHIPSDAIYEKRFGPECILEVVDQYLNKQSKDHRRFVGELDKLAQKWTGKRGNLIMILHEIQNHYGYVPREVAFELSRILDMPLARIYEVITFYHFFKLKPPAKNTINVCMGTACYLKGTQRILSEIKNILNIEDGQTTSDGLFQLQVVRCIGCCGLAPVMVIGEKVYGKVKPEEISEILSHYSEAKV